MGWTFSEAVVRTVGLGAFHGTHVVEIDPGTAPGQRLGFLQARFPTTPGQEYRLSFAFQAGFAVGAPQLAVTIDGTEPEDVATAVRFNDPGVARSTPDRGAWLEQRIGFFAQHDLTLIQLGPLSRWNTDIGWGRVWVDHARVEPLGRARTFGRDVALRATLPSTVRVGESVELTLSLIGMRRGTLSGGVFDTRPMRYTGSFDLFSDDALSTLPATVAFQDTVTGRVPVRFGSAGVWRLRVRSGAYEVLSNPVYVSTQSLARRAFWGDIHIHTELAHSDWQGGSGAKNYASAQGYADLDFAALSEHYHNAKGWMDELVPPTQAFNRPGSFVTLLGTETGFTGGHFNFYLRGSNPFEMFDSRNHFSNREALLDNLRARSVQTLSIPHHFLLLDPVDWRNTDRTRLRLAEIYSNHGSSEEAGNWWRFPEQTGNSYGDTKGAKGHDFRTALERGHRLGVIGCSDSHVVQPGMSGLTCVRASTLERESIWGALRRRDCFATSGDRILLEFRIGTAHMGQETQLSPGAQLDAFVEVHGQDVIEVIEFVRDGQVTQSLFPSSLDGVFTVNLGTFTGRTTWVYVRVRQRNQHRAWSSPIWIDPLGKPDLVLEGGKMSYDRARSELTVAPRNYTGVAATALLRLYSSASEPSLAGEGWLSGFTQPTLLLRVEPVNANQVRLKAALYTPLGLRRSFSYSGEIRLRNATGHRIVTDPRRMLADNGTGTLSWNDFFGYRYLNYESKAGQISDIELLIDTRLDTEIDVLSRIDGSPLSQVFVGSQVHSAAQVVSIPVGRIANTPPLATVSVTVPAHSRKAILFPSLPPGATYVAVIDFAGQVPEVNEDNNAFALVVPERATPYDHWSDYLPMTAGAPTPPQGPSAMAPNGIEPVDPCGPPFEGESTPLDLDCDEVE
ncbi:MAG: DUF3604 domain-containing protein [Planctomycetes bacterium]|nr:DUF3604 domain-containing protein [Planctomycetota bacterium]